MVNQIIELFLSDYYKIESVLQLNATERKNVFYTLGHIYLISDDELNETFNSINNNSVLQIKTYNDYKQYMRILKYYEMSNINSDIDSETLALINIKGSALSSEMIAYFEEKSCYTLNMIYELLTMFTDEGKIEGLRIFGMILSLNLMYENNSVKGKELLLKSARWNDISSILTMLYLNDNNDYYISLLKEAVEKTPYEALLDKAVINYGIDEVIENENAKLVNKAFSKGVIKRTTYNSQYERIIYSESIPLQDKQKVVLSNNNELMSLVNELPLKLTSSKANYYFDSLDKSNILKDTDKQHIKKIVSNSYLRSFDNYRPVCFVSNSKYLSQVYIELFNKIFKHSNVKQIDVSTFTSYDVEPTSNNVFVRSCNENKDNVYLLLMNNTINNKVIEYIKPFLNSSKRKEFRLNSPKITIDLKDVLIVCFANVENAKYLADVCELVYLEKINEEDKEKVMEDVILKKTKQYSLNNILVEDSAKDKLLKANIDEINSVIDVLIQKKRNVDNNVLISLDDITSLLNKEESNHKTYGFGGTRYESK